MNKLVSSTQAITRRSFILTGVQAAAVTGVASAAAGERDVDKGSPDSASATAMPYGMIGKVKISRMLLGGNLVGGVMHSRDLKYVGALFRAYVTEEKIMET